TRDPAGVKEFLQVARMLEERLQGVAVEPAFLEFAEPDIAGGLERLASRGACEITVMPLLLFEAGHAKHDIPKVLAKLVRQHPRLQITQAAPLGCHPALLRLSTQRFCEATQVSTQLAAHEKTLLLMVGRGSRDSAATQ